MNRAAVFGGYRRLLRARRTLFQGDAHALRESRTALREAFDANRGETDPARIKEMLKGIDEAEDMMLHGLVQARRNERGNFEVQDVKPVELGGGEFQPIDPAEIEERERELKDPKADKNAGIISHSKAAKDA